MKEKVLLKDKKELRKDRIFWASLWWVIFPKINLDGIDELEEDKQQDDEQTKNGSIAVNNMRESL